MKSVFFIGGGNMAYAIIGGLNRNEWDVVVADPIESQRKKMEKDLGVKTVSTATHPSIKQSNVVVFAVKPQSLSEVLDQLKEIQFDNTIVISVMAGVLTEVLKNGLKGKVRIVRTMPNTPLLVKLGVTGIFTTEDGEVRKVVEELLSSISQIYYVKEEDDLNKVTAISGSGPAYFYAFIEALQKSGIELGLDADVSAKMSVATALGAATLASKSKESISQLRQNVTSKGGTTEQALNSFSMSGLDEVVKKAAFAAYKRGQELGRSKL